MTVACVETPVTNVSFASSADFVWALEAPDLMAVLKDAISLAHQQDYAPLDPEDVAEIMDWALNDAPSDGRAVRDSAWR